MEKDLAYTHTHTHTHLKIRDVEGVSLAFARKL